MLQKALKWCSCRHHNRSRNLLDLAMARARLAHKSRGPCSRKRRLNSPRKCWILKFSLKSLVCLHLMLQILHLPVRCSFSGQVIKQSASSRGLGRMERARKRRPELEAGVLPLDDDGLW
ncbi:uncharacterized protein LOC124682813 [Lolium rigidum]|uniref:uncharacterized protein LOC124682813 n=1 Tax=Lolium rigidum TaxID=89674 RepID=UPI001F5E25E3|nr:uncharacterized protein LOC124682813 [Lolium rigidum]